MLKALADALTAKKDALYELSYNTGATKADSWIDIDGGIGTFAVYQGKGRRELPNERILIDGSIEALSRNGTFQGLHVFTSLQGVAVHINAFNFPVWGMLEKLAPTFLAGVPAIVKPASATSYLTEAAVRVMLEANVLPKGALQLIVGSTGDLFEHLTTQDVVSFTGSAATANKLKAHPVIVRESVRFVAEQDSLNASVLGPDAKADSPEFDLFIKEVAKEMTVKAGPEVHGHPPRLGAGRVARRRARRRLTARLEKIAPSAIRAMKPRGWARSSAPASATTCARRSQNSAPMPRSSMAIRVHRRSTRKARFFSPVLLRCENPWQARAVHDVEAFGPVSTLMPYKDGCRRHRARQSRQRLARDERLHLRHRLCARSGARLWLIPRPHRFHRSRQRQGIHRPRLTDAAHDPRRPWPRRRRRGDGRHSRRHALHAAHRFAGASAHTGGNREALHRRHADGERRAAPVPPQIPRPADRLSAQDQSRAKSRSMTSSTSHTSPAIRSTRTWTRQPRKRTHSSAAASRTVISSLLLLRDSFVDPDPGPVLANYGLDNLRFVKPVKPGDTVQVAFTVKDKTLRKPDQGEVRWDVVVTNRDGETVAAYDLADDERGLARDASSNALAGTAVNLSELERGRSDAARAGEGAGRRRLRLCVPAHRKPH
jgi:oxepin-CoA hydrolase/3-oxo-5,6-dehydrosuberyl-CoA semialdehyde dehydrogenase